MAQFLRGSIAKNLFGDGSVYERLDVEDRPVRPDHVYYRSVAEDANEGEGEVPGSLLVETNNANSSSPTNDTTASDPNPTSHLPSITSLGLRSLDPKERARWRWANVVNLDNFLHEVYEYYLGKGFACIALSRVLNMSTLLFVVCFSSYLTSCIDYTKIRSSHRLQEIQVPHCMARMSTMHTLTLWVFAVFWFLKLFQYIGDLRRLSDIHNFYLHLLDIPESDMQTISWQQVVKKLMLLRQDNMATAATTRQAKRKLDPHDIANRLMRKENYLIGMLNKDVLDLSVPLPFLGGAQLLTRTIEWHISLCVLDYVFNDQGQLRTVFLKESNRQILADGLRRRFVFAGFMNVVFAPFILVYLALLYFFRYFNDYHKDPGRLGSRQYTPLAEWKMRELNELPHLFRRRLNMSYDMATRYVNQFPKEKTTAVSKFVALVAGAFAAVLGIVSLADPELFLGFEITPDRTVLFYLGVFGTVVAVCRGMIPEESLVFEPEASLLYVAEFTHYLPQEWQGRLHSTWVKAEFAALFDLKIMVILRELLSVLLAPLILWVSLPKRAERIVDFYREFSVHVDGLGYVCSFAMFDFENGKTRAPSARTGYFASADGKMLKSYLNFVDNYGEHMPGQTTHRWSKRSPSGPTPPVSKWEAPAPLENSVMGRFNQLQGKDHQGLHSRRPFVPSDSVSLAQDSLRTQSFKSAVVAPGSDFETDLRTHEDEDPGSAEERDGGVLGLLNQFYKQSGPGGPHKV